MGREYDQSTNTRVSLGFLPRFWIHHPVAECPRLPNALFVDGIASVVDASTLDDLQTKLMASLRQNSVETRTRYAQSVVRWFFPDGLDGLAQKVWVAYHDDPIESDILRYLS